MKLLINGQCIFSSDVIAGIKWYLTGRQYMGKGDKVVVKYDDGQSDEYILDKDLKPTFRRHLITKKK